MRREAGEPRAALALFSFQPMGQGTVACPFHYTTDSKILFVYLGTKLHSRVNVACLFRDGPGVEGSRAQRSPAAIGVWQFRVLEWSSIYTEPDRGHVSGWRKFVKWE